MSRRKKYDLHINKQKHKDSFRNEVLKRDETLIQTMSQLSIVEEASKFLIHFSNRDIYELKIE